MSDPKTTPASGFVLRSPLLPYDELERFSEGLEAPAHVDERTLDADRQRVRERLRAIVGRPDVRDALFVASPDLDASIDQWLAHPDSPRGQKTERALVRYVERMAARSTPFGLFAGCTVGRIADETRLELEPAERNERHSRLDQDYLQALLLALEADHELRARLTFRPNSSLYRATGQLRYAETRMKERERSHHLTAVEESPFLDLALERARDGATPTEVAEAVASGGADADAAAGYVDQLVDAQVLVPDLQLPVTGPEALGLLASELAGHPSTAHAAQQLEEVRAELDAIDAGGTGADPGRYRAIAQRLEDLPAEVSLGRLFQVDLHKPAPQATLGPEVVAELARAADLLHRVAPPPLARNELQTFRERFAERYEGREVPLVEALDDDAGIGFPQPDPVGAAPLIKDLRASPSAEFEVAWGKRERRLLDLLVGAAAAGSAAIELSDHDVEELSPAEPTPMPDAFAVWAVLASSGDVYLHGYEGPSGARLLGRFAHGEPAMRALIEEHLRAEEAIRPDVIFAEIVHLPEGRIGNIIARPVLREYEIPYLGRSGVAPELQIGVDDLLVSVSGHPTVSPLGESIVLRSRRLGRRVIPRLTSAHNFMGRSVPIYRFLSSLQSEAQRGGSWDWGPLVSAPFLPRVTRGRLVLGLAQWRLDQGGIRALLNGDDTQRFRNVQALRERLRLPRLVSYGEYDNLLPVDLDNVLSVEAFLSTLKGKEEAILIEAWPGQENLLAHGPEGSYAHELILPFVRSAPREPGALAPGETGRKEVSAPRSLAPGTDWLYAKFYGGTVAADRVMIEAIGPLVEEVMASGAADSWFFIRYADPHEHIRLRFRGEPDALRSVVQPAVEDAFARMLAEGKAWRLTFDTYEREVERYGGPHGIEPCEAMFRIDSDTVLELMGMFEPGDAGTDERWKMALCGASMLLADCGLDEPARIAVLRTTRHAFGKEHDVDADLARKLGERLREHRRALVPLVVPGDDAPEDLLVGIDALRRRSERLAPHMAELRALDAEGKLATSWPSLASSFMHMYVNRLIRSAQRNHELAIYDFLLRLYESRAARARSELTER